MRREPLALPSEKVLLLLLCHDVAVVVVVAVS